MTTEELARAVLEIAHKAKEAEGHVAIYIGDVDAQATARSGLEAIITLCQTVIPVQPVPAGEDFRQYEKKKVTHETRKG